MRKIFVTKEDLDEYIAIGNSHGGLTELQRRTIKMMIQMERIEQLNSKARQSKAEMDARLPHIQKNIKALNQGASRISNGPNRLLQTADDKDQLIIKDSTGQLKKISALEARRNVNDLRAKFPNPVKKSKPKF